MHRLRIQQILLQARLQFSSARFFSTKAFHSGSAFIALSHALFLCGRGAGLSPGLSSGYAAQHLHGACLILLQGQFLFSIGRSDDFLPGDLLADLLAEVLPG